MKKNRLLPAFFIIFPLFSLFAQVPQNLQGIWEGKDRIFFFDDSTQNQLTVILKQYYGWYYDRTAEPESFSELEERSLNAGTTKEPVKVTYSINQLFNNTYEMELTYSKNQINSVPFAEINQNIYLEFFTRNNLQENSLNGFWQGNAAYQGFLISEQRIPENIPGYYIDGNNFFDIRYWKTNMNFEDSQVSFEYEGKSYYIPKHIRSGNNTYTCVSGRSKKVRNIQKPFAFQEEQFIINEDKTVLIPKKSIYLKKVQDKTTAEDFMQIVKDANARRKPLPPPVFPVKSKFKD